MSQPLLRELGYLCEAEATALTGLSVEQLRVVRLQRPETEWPPDAHGKKPKSDIGVLLGSTLGREFIYPRWNVTEYIRQRRGGKV